MHVKRFTDRNDDRGVKRSARRENTEPSECVYKTRRPALSLSHADLTAKGASRIMECSLQGLGRRGSAVEIPGFQLLDRQVDNALPNGCYPRRVEREGAEGERVA